MANNNNISIRTRIRKASTSINPEFGPSTESLVTLFVSNNSSSSWKKSKGGDSSIVISPLSFLSGNSSTGGGAGIGLGGGNSGGVGGTVGGAWRSASPLRSHSAPRGSRALSSSHRNRSFNRGHPPLVVRAGPTSSTNGGGGGSRGASPLVTGRKSPVTGGGGVSGGGRLEMDNKLQDEDNDDDGMVEISLQDDKSNHHVNNNNISIDSGGIMMELEAESRSSHNKENDDETREDRILLPPSQQQQRQRSSTSPLPIVRSGSGLSMPALVGVNSSQQQPPSPLDYQQPHRLNNTTLSSNNSLGSSSNTSKARSRSINARSRSINKNMRARSRSRSDSLVSFSGRGVGGNGSSGSGHQRRPTSRNGALSLSGRHMRSAGAANAFHTAATMSASSVGVMMGDDDSLDHSLHNKYHDEEMMIMEEMTVLLKDVISVSRETPTSSVQNKSCGVGGGGGGGDLHSPVGLTRVASFTPPTSPPPPPSQPLYRPGSKLSTTSQPACAHSNMLNSYRIYIHTRMNGFLEFNFDHNSNSYEVVLAYLRCHLKDGMVPPDDEEVGGGSGGGAGSSLEQPLNLTRTKSLSKDNNNGVVGGGDDDDATVTSTSTTSISSQQQQQQPPLISRSNSSNPIERLQTKAINHQLKQEQTPINSMKHNVSGWLSSIVDCASFGCCQDTTVTPEEEEKVGNNGIEGTPLRHCSQQQQGGVGLGQQSMTPRSKVLKSQGIGGLSFEVETVTSGMSGY